MTAESRRPVRTLADLLTLDVNEIRDGYLDGLGGDPCGDNRSRAFWHGWRVGRMDAGHTEIDDDQRALVHDAAPDGRMSPLLFEKIEREAAVAAREPAGSA